MAQPIIVERDGDIATVVLNSGKKLNALDMACWKQLDRTIDELEADDGVHCVVFRGAGTEAFAAGADIKEFETVRASSENAKEYGELVTSTVMKLAAMRHPTVAMIHGVCVGGGLEIASACDLRICGQSSRFGIPINWLGLLVGYPELALLIDLVGRGTALEILLEGRILDAGEATAKGLVNRVVGDGEVEAEAMATARRVADGAPLAARWHKKFVNRLAEPTPLTQAELDEAYACYDTEDYHTGRKAFIDKIKPKFKGR